MMTNPEVLGPDAPSPEDPILNGDLIVPQRKDILADLKDEDGLDERERNFLDILFDEANGDIQKAMTIAGYHSSTPQSLVTRRLNRFIKERTKEFLVSRTAKAAMTYDKVLNDPTIPGGDTAMKAAQQILDRGGVFKEEAVHVSEVRNMFILPAIRESDE